MKGENVGPVRWLDRVRLGGRRTVDETDWEIEHHLAEFADRLIDQGWDPAEAKAEAGRRFGDHRRYGLEMTRIERGRVVMRTGTNLSELIVEGLRSFFRTARRYPGFAIGVVLTLGLGIGANSTMYGIIDRLLLQAPDHITQPDRVRLVYGNRRSPITGERTNQSSITYPDYESLQAHSGLIVGGYTRSAPLTVGEGEAAGPVPAALGTASFFDVAGVEPRIGRFFTPDESRPTAPLTVVISEEYWARNFGSDPAALGQSLIIQGTPATIIGVSPKGFTGVGLARVDLWLPLEPTNAMQNGGTACMESLGCWWMQAAVRLHEDVTVEAAEAEATAHYLNGREAWVARGEDARIVLAPVIAAAGPEASAETDVARWLVGVSAIVLLIACANVANLLMARSTRTRRETGVRLALGASRARIVALTMIESITLAMVGGAVALVIARWGGWVVRSTLLPGVYFPNDSWSLRLIGFTLAVAAFAGIVAGLPPALQGRRTELNQALGGRGASGRHSRLRTALTVSQSAMSVVLLVGAGLFVRSLTELRSLDLGMDMDELLIIRPEMASRAAPPEEATAAFTEVQRRLEGIPGVLASATTAVPFQWGFAQSVEVPGLDSLPSLPGGGPYYFSVSEGYFETVGVRIEQGRELNASDGLAGDPSVVVSRTMAETLWPGESALGKCMILGEAETCTTVVGVAEDAARNGYQDAAFMAYYLPMAQSQQAPRAIYARTRGHADRQVGEVAAALSAAIPGVRFVDTQPLREMLDPQARSWKLGSTMFSVFGLIALLLAAIGLYGVLSFDVAQRTRELGIRTALGASQSRLMQSVVARGSLLGLIGVALGLVAAWFAAPYASEMLFETSPRDPIVLIAVAGILLLVCGLASLVPGLRATGVEPVEALRAE